MAQIRALASSKQVLNVGSWLYRCLALLPVVYVAGLLAAIRAILTARVARVTAELRWPLSRRRTLRVRPT